MLGSAEQVNLKPEGFRSANMKRAAVLRVDRQPLPRQPYAAVATLLWRKTVVPKVKNLDAPKHNSFRNYLLLIKFT